MLIERAKLFATAAHAAVGQRRKKTNEPYIVHPIDVCEIVASVTDDKAMLAACLLHDVIEDTEVTKELIIEQFGDDVANLVEELTDVSRPEDGNRKVRKALDRAHTAQISRRAKTIKLGDVISNTSTIDHQDPEFAIVYMREKQLLLEVLDDGNSELYDRACNLVADYFEAAYES